MPNTNKFVVKNGLQTQNVDFISPNGANTITLSIGDSDVLSISANSGTLFSVTDSFSGTIFSVNDISGVPSIEVLDTGLVKVAQYSGNVLIGTGIDNNTDKVQVNGSLSGSVLRSTVTTGIAPLTVNSTTMVTNLNANFLNGQAASFYTTTITDDTTTNATRFILFDDITSGNATTIGTSSSKLTYNPSTGTLSSVVVTQTSDESQKKDITRIKNALDTVGKLEGVEFYWIDGGKKSSGVTAQMLEKVLPHLIEENHIGVKSVNYSGIIGYLIEAIKELELKVSRLESREQ